MSTDMQSLVGKTYVDDRNKESEQTNNRDVVRHSELPEGTRIVSPDTFITMDYREDRWNVHIDEKNIVTKVKRG